jgi:hypothetical protein
MNSKLNFSIEQRELLMSEVQSKPPIWIYQHYDYKNLSYFFVNLILS